MDEQFKFNQNQKWFALGIAGIGLILLLIGVLTGVDGNRIWGSFLTANWYFLGLGLAGTLILALNYTSASGWNTLLKRPLEAMNNYVPIGALLFGVPFIIYLVLTHHHTIYHWTHEQIDSLLQQKTPYLNLPFFIIRTVIVLGVWVAFAIAFRKLSLKEDADGSIQHYRKAMQLGPLFLIAFAITISFGSWDWFMSLEPHWFSTIFAVYVFAGIFVGGWTVTALLTLFLKSSGHLKQVNENHFHDLGKFMFGFSIFWAYIWVSQYLLIWYGNLPEEVMYYYVRMQGGFYVLFVVNLFLNFLVPFLVLMMNTAKRSYKTILYVGIIMLVGRWIDVFLLVMPGAIGEHPTLHIGFPEIGFTLLYGGIFLYVVFNALSKAGLVAKNHPFIEESIQHEVL